MNCPTQQSFNQSSGDFVCTNKFYMNSLFFTKILFLSICSKFRDIRRHSDKDHTLKSIARCVLQINDDTYSYRYFILFQNHINEMRYMNRISRLDKKSLMNRSAELIIRVKTLNWKPSIPEFQAQTNKVVET